MARCLHVVRAEWAVAGADRAGPHGRGASCPGLAAAGGEAGGLGFLAGGYKTADGLYQELKQVRALTGRPFGVNLFLPQGRCPGEEGGPTGPAGAPPPVAPAALDLYRQQIAGRGHLVRHTPRRPRRQRA